ncbi:hypothetical protein C8J57DRAFT_1636549 [Mycena rebaudengoi]|nr:hypothetical protein C8J57DRAFT_1636549 [Mycena rebaudengoi]
MVVSNHPWYRKEVAENDAMSTATRRSLHIVHRSSWRQHRSGLRTASACSGRGGPRRLAARYDYDRRTTPGVLTHSQPASRCSIRLRRTSPDVDYDGCVTNAAPPLAPIHPPLHDPRTTPSENAYHRPSDGAISITVEQQEQRDVEQRVSNRNGSAILRRRRQHAYTECKRVPIPPQSMVAMEMPRRLVVATARADDSGSKREQKRVPAQPVQPVANGSAWAVQWQQYGKQARPVPNQQSPPKTAMAGRSAPAGWDTSASLGMGWARVGLSRQQTRVRQGGVPNAQAKLRKKARKTLPHCGTQGMRARAARNPV